MTDILLDVDTGVDDALAILFALRHPDLRVRGISCVNGNTRIDQVVRNTLKVLDAAGAPDIPVAAGARRALLAPHLDARHVHGMDGLADLDLPESTRSTVEVHAVELLRELIRAATEPITLVTLAPLTNIALLLRTFPEMAEGIERIMSMGGSASRGNATPVAEFNVWQDPEAAAIVYGSGLPLTMYGLDVFTQVAVPAPDFAALAASEEPGARLAGRLLAHQSARLGGDEPQPGRIGDAGAVCAVAEPDGLDTRRLPVRVELAGVATRGQTVVDHREEPGEDEVHGVHAAGARLDVALDVDAARYQKLFVATISGRR